jgi:hypothetical protein
VVSTAVTAIAGCSRISPAHIPSAPRAPSVTTAIRARPAPSRASHATAASSEAECGSEESAQNDSETIGKSAIIASRPRSGSARSTSSTLATPASRATAIAQLAASGSSASTSSARASRIASRESSPDVTASRGSR